MSGGGTADAPFVPLSEPELCAWGTVLGRAASAGGVFVALYGELGAGKSTLVRAACRGVGVEGPVPSPTFTLVNVHEAPPGPIYHADLYRLDPPVASRTLVDVGWPELLEVEGAVFVEWAERAGDWLPPDRWDVYLRRAADPSVREAAIAGRGATPPPPTPGSGRPAEPA